MANTLRAQAQSIPTPRKPTTNRGRRDVRNTVFVPSPQPSDVSGFGESPAASQGTFSSGKANSLSSEPIQGSDAHSIRSAHSVSSLAQTAAAKHPEMTEPGLNASVVETVSAWFSAGQVTRAVVIGELALSHNDDSSNNDNANASTTETIRLENFPVLEKVAPNPTFITPVPSRSGEYNVNLAHISSSSSSSSAPSTAVAFKYQVHLDPPNLAAHAPVVLTPTWKLEPAQASVIVSYAFNPAFVSPAARSVTLRNVVVLIHLDAATRATNCLSKPVGHFSRDKGVVFWRFDEVALDGYAEGGQKLLARFSLEEGGERAAGSVEARWEIGGDAAGGLGSGLGLAVKEDAGVGSLGGGGSDPFADESAAGGNAVVGGAAAGSWKEVRVQRKIVSGKYVAA
ncbi:MAG: hypothetical protein Q9202_002232 [Teloschistes flavicans]